MAPSMVVTEPQDELVDPDRLDSSQDSAPRISAWTGAPVSNSPWLSHKKSSATVKALQNRLNQGSASRRSGSVLPTTKPIQAQVGGLINQLPPQLKKEWSEVVKQVGQLSAVQHARLKEHVAIAKTQPSAAKSGSSRASAGASHTSGSASNRSISSTQHAAMRDAVSRGSNPTRAVMTSILGASALTDRSMISQALDAIQSKSNLRKGTAASSEKFWVDVFRAKFGRGQGAQKKSSLSYGRPDSTIVMPAAPNEYDLTAWGDSSSQAGRLAGLNASLDNMGSQADASNTVPRFDRGGSASPERAERDSSFVNALDRLDAQSNIGSSQLKNLNPSRLPAWAKGLDIPEAQYLSQVDAELANMEEAGQSAGRSSSSGAPVVNGWGSSSRADRMLSGRKQLAYIHKSGQIIPIFRPRRLDCPHRNLVRDYSCLWDGL